ncbi:hypothetical protein QL285_055981 [Trifolium repens]|nr:hypothetical protein QL285_055980 [Trifolium repens]KAK2394112.1 hypothetical protein QL285_055981 [Trifolium repens]
MAPKKSKRGKEIEGSSSEVPNFGLREDEFVHKDCITTYTQYCRNRSVLPQKFVSIETLKNLHLNDIAEILENEQLDTFCDLQTKYNDTLVRIFYAGLQERNGAEFEFCWGRKVYKFTANMWFDLFGMSTGNRITGEDLLAYSETSQVDYDSNVFISSITRNGNIPEIMGTGKLSVNARVVYWIVSHILRPKSASSRMDRKDIDLMFLLMEDRKVDWPFYIVSRMFDLRNSSRDQSFGYCSLIATVLKKFKVGQNLPIEYTTLGRLQKFSETQMAKMNWALNVDNTYVYHGLDDENEGQAAAPRGRRQRRNVRQDEGEGEGQGEEGGNWNEMMDLMRNMSMQQTTFYNEYTQNYQTQNARIDELYTTTNDLRTYVTTRFDEMQAQMHGYYNPNPPPNPDNMDE